MRTGRQKSQLELALGPAVKGEARAAGGLGTEARVAHTMPERPVTGPGPSMGAVVQPGNLKKALARVQRNKRAPGGPDFILHRTPAVFTTPGPYGRGLRGHWPARPAG